MSGMTQTGRMLARNPVASGRRGCPENHRHMRRRNTIGQGVAKLRFELGWTQDWLAARMQCHGVDVSREVVSNIESGRTQANDLHIMGFQKAFGVRITRLFPKAVQELDDQYAAREKLRPLKKPRSPGR